MLSSQWQADSSMYSPLQMPASSRNFVILQFTQIVSSHKTRLISDCSVWNRPNSALYFLLSGRNHKTVRKRPTLQHVLLCLCHSTSVRGREPLWHSAWCIKWMWSFVDGNHASAYCLLLWACWSFFFCVGCHLPFRVHLGRATSFLACQHFFFVGSRKETHWNTNCLCPLWLSLSPSLSLVPFLLHLYSI